MTVSSLPPLKPGTHIVHLPDIGVVTHMWDASGNYQGVYLAGQNYEDFTANQPCDKSDLAYLGSRIETQSKPSDDPHGVAHIRQLSHPNTGMDGVLVIRRDGTLLEFGRDAKGGNLKQLSSGALPAGDAYFAIGYWVGTQDSENVKLIIAVQKNGQWQLSMPDSEHSQPLNDLSNITHILGAGITQYGLRQRINIWARTDDGQETEVVSVLSYATQMFSYDLADCVQALCPPPPSAGEAPPPLPPVIKLNLPEPALIHGEYVYSVDFAQGIFRPETNDEQILLRFSTGKFGEDQRLYAIEITKNKDGEDELSLRISHSWKGLSSSMLNQQILIWPMVRAQDTIFVLPTITGGDLASSHLMLSCIRFDWVNNTVAPMGDQTFPLKDAHAPTGYAELIGWGGVLRAINPQKASLMLVMKSFIIKPYDQQHLMVQSAHMDVSLSADTIDWECEGWDKADLPTWLETHDTFGVVPPEFQDIAIHQLMVLPTDWTGNSFIYGAPRLVQNTDFNQVIGLYSVPPFEMDIQISTPQLTVDLASSGGVSNSDSQHSSTSKSVSASASVGAYGVDLNTTVGKSWSDSYLSQCEEVQNIDIRTTVNASQEELVQAVTSFLQSWTYPIYSKGGELQGEIAFYLPQSGPSPGFYSSSNKDFLYDQYHEVGMILSYLEVNPNDQYDPNRLMFNPVILPVIGDPSASAVLNYDIHNTKMTMKGETHNVSLSASVSFTLDEEYGPFKANAGLHYDSHQTVDNSNIHDVTTSNSFGLTFHLGYVSDPVYEYEVKPLVYRDEASVKRIRYELNLTGIGWKQHFAKANPVMFRVLPFSDDKLLGAYSRTIRFIEDEESGNVWLRLMLFNNGFGAVDDLICNIYDGLPKITEGLFSIEGLPLIKCVGGIHMTSIQRLQKDFPEIKIKKGQKISVQLVSPSSGRPPKTYWGCYPYSDAGDILGQPAQN